MAEAGLTPCCSSILSWISHLSPGAHYSTQTRSRSRKLYVSGRDQNRREERLEDFFSDPSTWSGSSWEKRKPRLSDLRETTTGHPRWAETHNGRLHVDSQRASGTQQQNLQKVLTPRRARHNKPVCISHEYEKESGGVLHVSLDVQSHSWSGFQPLFSPGELAASADDVQRLCDDGQLASALDVLLHMESLGSAPPFSMYRTLLKACSTRKALVQAKQVHAHLAQYGLGFTRCLGERVLCTLVKCGGLDDALQVFENLPSRTVFSWTAVISGYAESGQPQEALRMYNRMQEEGVHPNTYTFVVLLQACANIPDLEDGKRIHAEITKYRFESDLFVGTSLVDMYAKCGSIQDAQNVFDRLSLRSVVSWTAMLAAYAHQGEVEQALQLYEQMKREGVSPNDRTLVSVLQACGMLAERKEHVLDWKVMALKKGKAVHAYACRKGHESDVFVGSALISMYGKCGSLLDAQDVFLKLSQRSGVAWNAMLSAYAHHGQADKVLHLYNQMLLKCVSRDVRTFVTVFQACGMLADEEEGMVVNELELKITSVEQGRAVHMDASTIGYGSDSFIGNSLVSMYGKCGSTVDAQHAFDALHEPDVVAWTAILAAYTQQGQADKALQLYELMQEGGVSPNGRTYVSTLQACSILAEEEENVTLDGRPVKVNSLSMTKLLCVEARRKNYMSDVFIGSTLVSVYGKCGSIVDAQHVFDDIRQQDVVAWTSMLTAYAQQGDGEKALHLYTQMQEGDVSPNDRTFVSILQACGVLAEEEESSVVDGRAIKSKCLELGKAIHAEAARRGFDSDVFVGNTLVSVYGKCGSIADAQNVFDGLSQRSVVSWNAMLSVCVEQGQCEQAVEIYSQLLEACVTPNEITAVCMLQACSSIGSLDLLRKMHHTLVFVENNLSPLLATSLIHAYGRCASMVDAQKVFDILLQPDVVAWNALLAGYAWQGNCAACLHIYEKMRSAGAKPNGATFLSLLSACGHAGLVEEGIDVFNSMRRDHDTCPTIEHYVCMVDLLGRAGDFVKIEEHLSTMPMQPNLSLWLCLLAACRKHGKVALGKKAFDSAVRLQPKHSAAYVLMSNIYSQAEMWESAKEVYALEKQTGAWKKPPGQSWIEHDQEVSEFVVADKEHADLDRLYHLVDTIGSELCLLSHARKHDSDTADGGPAIQST